MKLQLLLLLYCLCLLAIFSCEKSETAPGPDCTSGCLTFEGSVRSAGKDSMVSGVIVRLHKRFDTYLGFKSKIGETKTDTKGAFSLNIDGAEYAAGQYDFQLTFHHPNYIQGIVDGEVWFYDIDSSNFDKPLIENWVLFPTAFVKIDFSRSSTYFQQIEFSKKYNGTLYRWYANWTTRDTSFVYQIAGDTTTNFTCSKANSNQNFISEKINIAAGDTAFFEIKL